MNKKGFTLIELMVVVLIIAILVAMAIPFYNTAVDNHNNERAKVYLEAINGGLERFHKEYPNVTLPHRGVGVSVLRTPSSNATCTYSGQQYNDISGTDITDKIQKFIEQLIVCGYIPRYNYGEPKVINDGNFDYKFILQNQNDDTTMCGNGRVYAEAKIDEEGKFSVGNKFCNPFTDNTESGDVTICAACVGIDITNNGRAKNMTKNDGVL